MEVQQPTCESECPSSEPRNRFDFRVDAERLVAYSEGDTAELTVREILDMSGNQPVEDYSLVELVGGHHHDRIKHENLDELLYVKPHARFAALFKGCTPVS